MCHLYGKHRAIYSWNQWLRVSLSLKICVYIQTRRIGDKFCSYFFFPFFVQYLFTVCQICVFVLLIQINNNQFSHFTNLATSMNAKSADCLILKDRFKMFMSTALSLKLTTMVPELGGFHCAVQTDTCTVPVCLLVSLNLQFLWPDACVFVPTLHVHMEVDTDIAAGNTQLLKWSLYTKVTCVCSMFRRPVHINLWQKLQRPKKQKKHQINKLHSLWSRSSTWFFFFNRPEDFK